MVRAIAAQEDCGVVLRNQAEKFYYFTRIDHKNCGEVRNYFMFFRTFLFFSMVKKGCIKPYYRKKSLGTFFILIKVGFLEGKT